MIGVCIKYFHENYGGMLQAYATVRLLEQRGLDYELIRYRKRKDLVFMLRALPRLLNVVLLNDKYEGLRRKLGQIRHSEYALNDAIRRKAFEYFSNEHFTKLSTEYYGMEALKKGSRKYSAVLSGSDQLWSPSGLPTNFYNLMFVPDVIRKISIASSFGVKDIPWYQKGRTKAYLNRIEFVSMRENHGTEIVKKLTGRDVPVIVDPVFIFDRDKWRDMIPENKMIEGSYIFAYFLGDNPDQRKAVRELAITTGLPIVTMRHLDQYVGTDENFGDFAPYDVGPVEFLNWIRGASFVCTDSFHGSAFSIIHRKQFVIFNRYAENSRHSKNSRIDSLCHNLGISERRYHGDIFAEATQPIDYADVERRLALLKEKTNKYLDMAFSDL